MNDEEKVFAISELFYVEEERWGLFKEVEKFSEAQKLDEITKLRYKIHEAKEILDKPHMSDDD